MYSVVFLLYIYNSCTAETIFSYWRRRRSVKTSVDFFCRTFASEKYFKRNGLDGKLRQLFVKAFAVLINISNESFRWIYAWSRLFWSCRKCGKNVKQSWGKWKVHLAPDSLMLPVRSFVVHDMSRNYNVQVFWMCFVNINISNPIVLLCVHCFTIVSINRWGDGLKKSFQK